MAAYSNQRRSELPRVTVARPIDGRPDPAKEAFLGNIAKRLGRPRLHVSPDREGSVGQSLEVARHDRAERFARELTALAATCRFASSLAELHLLLRLELARWNARRLISWDRAELSAYALDWLWDELGCATLTPGDAFPRAEGAAATARRADEWRARAMRAEVGITGVDYAVAMTGTLVLAASRGRPRAISLVPPVHIALVREAQIVERMGEALANYFASGSAHPSAVHFISGPSRTSDIENDHTIGVHGPAAVSVLVLRDAPSQTGSTVASAPTSSGPPPA